MDSSDAADRLLDLLRRQREVLLRSDPDAVAELEANIAQMEQAVVALGGLARQASAAPPGFGPAAIARLQAELQANQAVLANLASSNRRALNALFGEPSLYSK